MKMANAPDRPHPKPTTAFPERANESQWSLVHGQSEAFYIKTNKLMSGTTNTDSHLGDISGRGS